MITVVHRDRLYIPADVVDRRALRDLMEVPYTTKKHCHTSCQFANTPSRFCSTCPGRDARIVLWRRVRTRGGLDLIAIAGGNRRVLDHIVLGDYRVLDRRADVPFRTGLVWTGRLRTGAIVNGRATADQRGMLSAWRRSIREGETGGVIISPPRCVTGDTLVLTQRGLVRIEDWCPDDHAGGWLGRPPRLGNHSMVATLSTGAPVRATDLWRAAPEQALRVTLRGGLSIAGTEDHPLRTAFSFTPLRSIRPGQAVPVFYGQNVWGNDTRVSPAMATFLGFWVSEGSGGRRGVHITNYDDDVRDFCRRAMLHINPGAEIRERVRAGSDPRLGLKRCLGTRDARVVRTVDLLVDGLWRKSAQKVIPRSVLQAPRSVVGAFLRGLFEGDGWCTPKGVGYCSISRELVFQIQVVLHNMGIICSVRPRWTWASNGGPNQIRKRSWTLLLKGGNLVLFRRYVGFFSARKQGALNEAIDLFEGLGHHQPAWHDYFPGFILHQYAELVTMMDAEFLRFPMARSDGRGVTRWPVSVSNICSKNGDLRVFSRRLSRPRLQRYWDALRSSPRWWDLSPSLRARVTSFHEDVLRPNTYWTRVRRIEKSQRPLVTYDIHVPGHHQFMANGLLNHNSGKCVLPNTMVRTQAGYHHISRFFVGRDTTNVVEEIGSFGRIAAPGGNRDVRGIYAQTVETVVTIDTACGITLGGSEVHPIQIVNEIDDLEWRTLGELRGDEQLVLARELTDPVPSGQGLQPESARLVALCIRHAHYARFCTGVLHFTAEDLRLYPEIANLLMHVCSVRAPTSGDLMISMRGLAVLDDWPDLLMASGIAAWRAFARSVVVEDPHSCVAVLPDENVARALQMHLIGQGVACDLRTEPGSFMVVVRGDDAWSDYVQGVPVPEEERLTTHVRRILRDFKPRRVMDLRIPQGAAFHTNGLVSHNTVIGVAAALSERTRTFITASKIDFLRQFGKRFGELTNLRELASRGRTPVVLVDPSGWPEGRHYGVTVYKRWRPEVNRADVVMSNCQQFMNTAGGRERMARYLVGRFGLLIGDEIHQGAAEMFSDLINLMDCRRKLGLTATIHRKDKTEKVVLRTLGPVRAKGNCASDLPMIEIMETGISSTRSYRNWNAMTNYLTNLEEANRVIVRQVFADLRANPLHSILITTTRTAHIALIVKMINAQAEFCRQNRDESWPADLAVAYQGGSDTSRILNTASSGRTRVVVAMVQMVQLGLDVSRWTHVYVGCVPISNMFNVYQLINRVCTPYSPELEKKIGAKPQSVARIFVHSISASVFSFAKLFRNPEYGLKAGLTTSNFVGVRLYRMTPEVFRRAALIASDPKSYDAKDVGVDVVLGRTRTGKRRRKSAWTPRKGGVTSL